MCGHARGPKIANFSAGMMRQSVKESVGGLPGAGRVSNARADSVVQ